MRRAEIHCHSNSSKFVLPYAPFLYDSVLTCDEIIQKCIKEDIKILSITDHDSLAGFRVAKEIIKRKSLDILLIPGCEISSMDGHILAYGITEEIPPKLSAEETIHRVHSQGGIAVAAHPYMFFSLGNKIREFPFDAVETFNAQIPNLANRKAKSVSHALGLPGVVGSDAHVMESLGMAIMLFEDTVNSVEEVLQAISSGAFDTQEQKTRLFALLKDHLAGNIRIRMKKDIM